MNSLPPFFYKPYLSFVRIDALLTVCQGFTAIDRAQAAQMTGLLSLSDQSSRLKI
jgi:hypothetical protein